MTTPEEKTMIEREAVARIIDPDAWALRDHADECRAGYNADLSARLSRSRSKADAILALTSQALAAADANYANLLIDTNGDIGGLRQALLSAEREAKAEIEGRDNTIDALEFKLAAAERERDEAILRAKRLHEDFWSVEKERMAVCLAVEHHSNSGTPVSVIVRERLSEERQLRQAAEARLAGMVEALQKIADAPAWGFPDRWEVTPSEVRSLAREALSSLPVGVGEKGSSVAQSAARGLTASTASETPRKSEGAA